MKEIDYINVEALGTIRCCITSLRNICPENLKHIIKKGELNKVFSTLYDWQERLYKDIHIENEESENDKDVLNSFLFEEVDEIKEKESGKITLTTSKKIETGDNIRLQVNDIGGIKVFHQKKEKEYSLDIYQCYDECIKFFSDNLKPKNNKIKQNWIKVIDELNRLDKIPFDEIIRITKSAREDDFWSKNFLSLTKLRMKNKEKVPYHTVFSIKFKDVQSKNNTQRRVDIGNSTLEKFKQKYGS
jgi:hypothetical protein